MLVILPVVLLLAFLLAIHLDFKPGRRGHLPFISFVAAYYFVFYGVFSTYAVHFVKHPPYAVYVSGEAVAYIVSFLMAQILGYAGWYAVRQTSPSSAPALRTAEVTAPVVWVAATFIALHMLFYLFPRLLEFPSLPQLRRPLWDFGFAVLGWLAIQRRLPAALVAGWIGVSAIKFAQDMTGGQLTSAVFSLMVVILAAICHRRLVLSVMIALVTALLLTSYGYVKHVSRALLTTGPTGIFSLEPELSARSIVDSVNGMARRSAHALVLQRTIERTPSEVPYSDHNPLGRALLNHVPRAIWADKPLENMGNAFGKKYGLLNSDDNTTSWNVPWAVDFYIAGGFLPSLLSALLLGLAFAAVTDFMSRRDDRTFFFGLYAATIFPLFYQESNFSMMTGSLLWSGLAPIVCYWIARRFHKPSGVVAHEL